MSATHGRNWFGRALVTTMAALAIYGCGWGGNITPPGAIVGRFEHYDYSPSVVQTGTSQQIWWCGEDKNPSDAKQNSDTIQYQAVDSISHERSVRQVVLAETAGSWDSVYTCNPHVVKGVFKNPLNDGQTYNYEMFYVATTALSGTNNSIGVAFSKDGISWKKYKDPVISSTSSSGYGVGQPVLYNRDGKSGIVLFYEDSQPTVHHVKAISYDGIHFTVQGTVTTAGLDPNNSQPTWGDMGYDPSTGYWYALFNQQVRQTATTGGNSERGQYGVELCRIPDRSLLTGSTPWERLKTIDTNLTGYESNFIGGLLHDSYGNVNIGPYPNMEIFLSASNPRPAWDASAIDSGKSGEPNTWDIVPYVWTAGQPTHPLVRFKNSKTYETTTGWIDPGANFTQDMVLGDLYDAPRNGADVALYGCKAGRADYFVSLDPNCGGQRVLGVNGFAYASPGRGQNRIALYACSTPSGLHFVSKDQACEGGGQGALLGYALPVKGS